jgi:amino acid adenylation domain-containing protein
MSRTNIENIYPLSPMQQGMLFHTLYAEGPGMYFVQIGWTLRGQLDVAAFVRAWEEVVARHPILRTGFAWERLERPVQIVRRQVKLPLIEIDLRGLSTEEQAARLAAFNEEDRVRGFDLAKAPLLRIALLRLADDAYRFVWSRHHILLDGWSTPLLVKEVFALYEAYSQGKELSLDRPRPFGEYISWLGKQSPADTEAFWRQQLAGFRAPTPLVVDHLTLLDASDTGFEEAKVALSDEASAALQAFARKNQLTLGTLVQAAWALLLSRYSGEPDVLFGGTVSGRSAPVPGIDRMIGLFINTLPVRVRTPPTAKVLDWLATLQAQQAELREHEHAPLVEVQRWSDVPRGTPLFESLVVFENYPVEDALRQGSRGLTVDDARTAEQSNYPLTLIGVFRRSLVLRASYERRRFDAATIARLLGHLRALLEGMVRAPESTLEAIPMVEADEREQLLFAWNDRTAAYPVEAPLHALFEAQVDRTPDAVAVSFEDRSLTYRELDERANRLARRLVRLGVAPGQLVGLAVRRSLDMVVGILGILKAGAAYLPLDPDYPKDRLAFMIADASVRVLVTEANLTASLSAGGAAVIRFDADAEALAAESPLRLGVTAAVTDLAYVIYTSGSTGKPKGVLVRHDNVVRLFHATRAWYDFQPSDVWTLFHSYAFDFSVWELWGALLYGGRVVVVPHLVSRSPDAFHELLVAEGVTVLSQTPSAFRQLIRADQGAPEASIAALRLRYVVFGGEALDVGDLRPWWDRHGDERPRLVNMYGITETTVHVTYRPLGKADLARAASSVIGAPIPDLQVYVLDPTLAPVPVGVAGELYVGGAGVASGYLDRPELTAQRFLPDPFSKAEASNARLYRTGDLARRLPNGDLEYRGRIDHQVKIRGFRIELGEVEAALDLHPAVREAVALVREDEPGDKRLVAYVVPKGRAPSILELRASLKERLPEYMVPSAFVFLPALPLTENGKVSRRELPEPDVAAPSLRAPTEPRGPVEDELAGIFAEVLRLPRERVGAHEGFFDLGGHSLLATQAISRIRAAFGIALPLAALFEDSTVAELAARIAPALQAAPRSEAAPLPPILPIPRDGQLPMSFGQERLWFLAQLDPDDVSYIVPFTIRFEGALDTAALARALREIVRRHEVLRTTFATEDNRPVQVIRPEVDLPFPIIDLGALPEAEREPAVRRELAEETRRPFDLTEGPLLRTRLLRLGAEDHVLLFITHHIVADAWTRGVLHRELAALYTAFAAGRPSPLPELAVQYADYALWQRRWLEGNVLDAQLAYWKKRLAGAPPSIDLPTDRPRPAVRTNRGERRVMTFSPELTRAIKELSLRSGVTLFMTLLAAFDVVLHRWSRQGDIVVGAPIAGRTQAETENLIGFFLNTLVLRTELSDELPFKDLLTRVKDVCLGAYAHQVMPFERLVQEIAPERDLSRTPIFQVLFNLQNTPTAGMAMPGLKLRGLAAEVTTTKVDLTLIMREELGGLVGSLAYSTDLFDGSTIERMLAQLRLVLEGAVKEPQKPIGALALITEQERHEILVAWNETGVDFPVAARVHDLFEEQVDAAPDALALVAGPERLTFGELDRRSNRLAHHLRGLGVGPDVVVGLLVDRSAAMIIGLLGILKAGGAYVPLDPGYPEARLVQIVEDAGARVVVTLREFAAAVPAANVTIVRLDADAAVIDAASDARPDVAVGDHHLAYVLFTSGSTGKPKGVAIEHRQLVNYVRGVAQRLDLDLDLDLPAGASYAHVSTFSADLGNTVLFPPLCLGGTLHVIAQDLTIDPDALGAYFAREGIDCLKIVPSHLSALLSGAHPERALPRRLLVLGGEASSWELIERIEKLAPDLRILNHYGPTETTVGVLTHAVQRGRHAAATNVPLGRPLPNSRVYVLDPSLQPTPIGVPGEVFIGGAGVARGYLGHPELTAERFLPDPFRPAPFEAGSPSKPSPLGARLYRTGDRARSLPDGTLVFLGRIDFQVKIRGFRIELGEIEAALLTLPAVKEAVVLAQDDASGDKRLVAYVVPRDVIALALDHASLIAGLAERLPDYMVPRAVVALAAIPITSNGKIDRRALEEIEVADAVEDGFVAPRNPVEEVIAGIWSDVFEREHIGVHDRFSDLGGHSLLAIQIIARTRDAFQAEVPLRAIFEAPTVAGLADVVSAALREGEGLTIPSITRAPRDGAVPLSFSQERLWFLDQLEPGNSFYNVPLGMRFTGALDAAALQRAVREVARRHEILRTTFAVVAGKPVQVIHEGLELDVPFEDLTALPLAEREPAVRREAAAEVRRAFDLARGPLIRARLLRVGPEDHALLLTTHHIVSDFWTRGVLTRETTALYDAFRAGKPSPLPELPIQYADYAIWQRRFLGGGALDRQLAYWKAQLEGAPPMLSLPTDRPRPPLQSHRGSWDGMVLPAPLVKSLKELSRREGVTLFMTLLAAFDLLLHRYTGQGDIVVGTPVANRTRAETEGLIGFFVNTLVLRTKVDEDGSFLDLLQSVRETCLGAYAHQDISFERLVQAIAPERDLSRSPLFQVLISLQNQGREVITAEGDARVGGVRADSSTSKYDVTMAISDGARGLVIAVEYATDLFDASTIARMLGHYRTLVEALVAAPAAPLAEAPILTAKEREQLLVTWNHTAAEYPKETPVHALFEAQVDRTPEAVAAVFGEERLTYRELDRRANQVARYLQRLGVGPDVLVGLCLQRSLSMVVSILGILKAGGAYVPLDPSLPTERLAWMLEDSAAPVVLTEEKIADDLPVQSAMVHIDADWPMISLESGERPASAVGSNHLAYIIYTSGSTGTPKGVMIPHRGLVNYLVWAIEAYRAGEGEGSPVHSSIGFDLTVTGFFTPLLTGRAVTMLPEEGEIEALVAALVRPGNFSLVKLTPAHVEVLNQLVPRERAAGATGALVIGGEALSWETLAFFRKNAPATRLINEYGPTETVVGCCVYDAPAGGAPSGVVPIGRPIANTRLYVLDARRRPVPIGVSGELYIGGDGVARGYLNRPDLTAERFVVDPFSDDPASRLYRTGDLCRYLPGGDLEFLGRIDDQIKIRGYRIELGEIESVLGQHPQIAEVVVIAREDVPGDKRLVAYLVAADEAGPEPAELKRFLATRLPEYMVPTAYVLLASMPLTSNGKVDRRALPAPEARAGIEGDVAPPRSPVEEVLAGIWAEILDLDLPELGIHDNFFDLGGHSLLATQVMGRIISALQVEIPLQSLFEAPTVAGLAERVSAALQAGAGLAAPPLGKVARDRELLLSFAQERLWFLDQLEPGSTYVIPGAVRIEGALDAAAIERSLQEIVRRHEVLRTTFTVIEGEGEGRPVQVIHDDLPLAWSTRDLSALPPIEREAAMRREVTDESRRPFDLAAGPLLRARLLRLADADHVLLFPMHHIASDGWSNGIFLRELGALYSAFVAGRASPLAELPIQYADYAQWQRAWLTGEALDRQIAYWKAHLEGAPRALDLPTDRPRPPVQTHRGARRAFGLSPELTAALKDLARREGVTLFMLLLAGFDALLWRTSGQDDLVVGTPIANRTRTETERLIGFFLNTLVIRAVLPEGATFRDLLQSVKASCLGAYAHQDTPFERLVAELEPERDLSRSPLFQVMFTLQAAPAGPLELAGLTLRGLSAAATTSKFDLTLWMAESPSGLLGSFEYSTDLFDEATIDRMAAHLRALLEGAVADPGQAVAALPMLSADERRQLLEGWNDTRVDYPTRDATIPDLFAAQAARTPEAVAVTFDGEELTYRELDQRSSQLAQHLARLGVGPDVLVGIAAPRSIPLVLGLLAIFKAGGAYVSLDPEYPRDRLAFMIEDARLSVLLTTAALAPELPAPSARVVLLDTGWEAIAAEPATDPARAGLTPEHLAYVIYTSGSTGKPKGVAMTQRPLVNLVAWQIAHSAGPLRTLQFASPSFDVCFQEIFTTWCSGGTLVLIAEDARRDAERLMRRLVEGRVERLFLPPVALYQLAEVPVAAGALPTTLREIIPAGEALQITARVADLLRRLPGCVVRNHYGPSETHVVTEHVLAGDPSTWPALPPIGKPIANVRVYLLDPRGEPVPIGVRGELFLGGVQVARGYLGRPDLTAERFLRDPFSDDPSARVYRTGDVARRLLDGTIEFLGRADFQVKIRGFRVELGEIEILLGQHPAVRDVVVVAREDAPGDKRLVAYLVPSSAPPSAADLRAFLKDRLPEYMVPSAFVVLDALPLTGSGKIDRLALPAPGESALADQARVAPRGPVEEGLASIFAEVLKLSVEQVGAHDGFFDLGGHSLLATQVVARARAAFAVEIPLRALFEAATPAELARWIEGALRAGEGTEVPRLTARAPAATRPLSFAEERLWFLDQLEPDSASYAVPVALRLVGALDRGAPAAAIAAVVSRHEILRTAYPVAAGRPVAVVHDAPAADLPLTSLSASPDVDRVPALRALVAAETSRPFDLAAGPVFRARLFELAEGDHVLLLTMHHIVSDGWSLGVLHRELGALYEAFAQGRPSPLPALALQYGDYAAWQRAWLQGEALARQLAYWTSRLEGAPAALDLPTDRPRPPVQTTRGDRRVVRLSPALLRDLKDLGRREGATLFMVLLAALDVLLHRHAGQDDIVIGTPIANRTQAESESLLGVFINTLALRTELTSELTFSELLARVKETCLGAYAHQDLPFERLVQEVAPERDLSRSPLFQVLFVLQNAPSEAQTSFGGLEVRPTGTERTSAKFDLALAMAEGPQGLTASLVFNADLFDGATAARLLEHLRILLEGIVAAPGTTLGALPIMSDEERQRVVVTWNETATDYPREASIPALFAAEAARRPDAVAVVFGAEALTYGELDRRSSRLAHALVRRGVAPGDRVGLLAPRGLAMVVATLAILKAGGAYVPLDPSFPPQRLAFLIEDTAARVLVTAGAVPRDLALGSAAHLDLDLPHEQQAIAVESDAAPIVAQDGDSLAYVMFTSGSTGTPKGVCALHRGVVRLVKSTDYARFGEDEVFLQLAPIAFDAATLEIWGPLLNGGRLVVAPPSAPSLAEIGALIHAHGITTLWLTAGLFNAMVESNLEGLRPLRQLLAGGDALSVPHVAKALAELPNVRLINGYGPTEGTTFTACHAVSFADTVGSIPIGRPIANTRVYVLDAAMAPVPIGVAGELYAGGDGVARGYLGRPELTAERFVADPFGPGRLYRTGDRVRFRADGALEFLGRLDQQVKLRGFRIELGEIEAVLGQHPGVRGASVIVREDLPGDKRLVAYVVAEGASASPADLATYLEARLPAYMVPSAFVTLAEIPLTANGKVDRRALPAPDLAAIEAEAHIAPRGPVEEGLAAIFAEVLRREDIGARDGFFALGGHSLLAAQAIARVRAAFGVELPLRAIFEAPTVAELGARVEAAIGSDLGVVVPPIVRVQRGGGLALSFAQERMWFLAQLEPGDPSYVVPLTLRLEGALDRDALLRALEALVARHEVLRTTFHAGDEGPYALIRPPLAVPFELSSIRASDPALREREVRATLAEDMRSPIDLRRGPLLRARVFALGEGDHLLALTMDHIVADAWTLGILRSEIGALYEAALAGRPADLPALSLQYADYAAWQRRFLAGEVLDRQLAYWKQQLAFAPEALDLPTDRPRPPVPSRRGGRCGFTVAPETSRAILDLARRRGVTLFMTLLAAFDVLLYRLTGQTDLVVGMPAVNRGRAETERMVGVFLNTLVLRTQIDPALPFEALLDRVRETCLGAYAHQDMPFERLVAELGRTRDPSLSPLFQVMFTLHNAPTEAVKMGELRARGAGVEVVSAKFDLTLGMGETAGGGLAGSFEYATDLFDAATMTRIAASFCALLEGLAQTPTLAVGALPLQGAEERRTVVETFNATRAEYAKDALIHELFAAQATRTPEAIALVFEGISLTYGELDRRSNQLAHALRKRGVGPEVLVGVCLTRSIELVVALYGVLKAGGAYVPLDPEYPKDRLAFMLADTQVPVLLTQAHLEASLPAHSAEVLRLDTEWPSIAKELDSPLDRGALDLTHLAYVIYTSGSTGRPKGVMNEHRGILNRLQWMQEAYGLTATDRVLQKTPFSFDVSVWEFFWPLMSGATLVVARPEGHKDPAYLVDLIGAERITTLHFVPSMLKVFTSELDRETARARCRSLTRVFASGEALLPAMVDSFAARLPNAALHNLYGPTEAAVDVTAWSCAAGSPIVPIGKPIKNARIYLLDELGAPVPIGIRGELFIGGVQVARGYLNRPELTAERFVPDPFVPEEGYPLYRSGDLARWLPTGDLEYLGRLDHQVKLRGFRIELGEIEAALAEQASVREVVVVAREDAPGDRRLVAYLAPAAGASPSVSELRSALRERLPEHMIPSAFVVLDALPLTASGKIDRRALPAPELGADEERAHVAPRGPVEEALARIFAEVLKIADVSATADFFELGGHSLLATQVKARIAGAFQIEIPLQAMFEAPTVAALAARVDAALRAGRGLAAPALTRGEHGSTAPLSFGQERLWFLAQLEPDDRSYNIPLGLHFEGPLDRLALAAALRELVRRHEVLRTTMEVVDQRPASVLHEDAEIDLPVTSLAALPSPECEATLQRQAAEEGRRAFDLARGPLIRARLFELGAEDHVLFLVVHHIVSDGWSNGILNRELTTLYRAFVAGKPSPLPELPIQYADFARWQRRWLQGDALSELLAYWKAQLDGSQHTLDLPSDRPRPPLRSHRAGRASAVLPRELLESLKELARREGATLFMTLLAALHVLLHRYSGQRDILIGSPIAGRSRAETENLIGFFLNTLVLRARPSAERPFRELLREVKEACLGAYAHQDMPFERLVAELAPKRDLARSPLFQVSFILQNTPREAVAIDGVKVGGVRAEGATSTVDLTLAMSESKSGLNAVLDYAVDLFDPATIERLFGHLRVLLEGIVADPTCPIGALPLLTPAERARMLVDWNATAMEYPRRGAHHLVEAQVDAAPDAVAVACAGREITYRELDRRGNQLARALQRRGVGPGARVGISLERSIDMVVAALAVLKSGAAYVPLDPTYPRERLAFIAADASLQLLLTQASLADRIAAPTLRLDADAAEIAAESDARLEGAFDPETIAYVLYTSGSTGKPKGVRVPHRALASFLTSMRAEPGFTSTDRLLAVTSLSFDIAGLELFLPLSAGGRVEIADSAAVVDGARLAALLAAKGITVMQATPSTWRLLLDAGWSGAPIRALVGGEAVPRELVDKLAPRVASVWNMYGPTETTIWSTTQRLHAGGGPVLIGRPIGNTQVYVLDGALQPVPVGVPGELHIGGEGVALGYLDRPELTAQRFIASPFIAGATLYKTGDLCRFRPDGALEFLGRLDFQVKLRGYRIELGEIEAVLAQHPAVAEAVALVREDVPGDKRLVAYLVARQESSLVEGDLRAFLGEKLPGYMSPTAYVILAAMPLTPNGKVDRRALPAPEAGPVDEAIHVAPRNPIEVTLAEIWQQVLGRERVGATDDFFELGGHSLLATQVVARIAEALAVEIPLASIFQARTLGGLAAIIQAVLWARPASRLDAASASASASASTPDDADEREEGEL